MQHYELWHSFREVHKVSTWPAVVLSYSASVLSIACMRLSEWVGLVITCNINYRDFILICSFASCPGRQQDCLRV